MDIRNYFSSVNKNKKPEEKKAIKRKKYVIDESDSDEEPIPKSLKKSKAVSDSDDDIFFVETKKKTEAPKKLTKPSPTPKPSMKATSTKDFFGSKTVQRSDQGLKKEEIKKKTLEEKGSNEQTTNKQMLQKKKLTLEERDSNFEKTLKELDNQHPTRLEKKSGIKSPRNEKLASKLSKFVATKAAVNGKNKSPLKKEMEKAVKSETEKAVKSEAEKAVKNETEKNDRLKGEVGSRKSKENISDYRIPKNKGSVNKSISKMEIIKEKPKKVATPEKLNDSIIPATPEEKVVNPKAMAYKKYLQRAGPKNPGSKLIPEGSPNCLARLTFVMTGVLESFGREEITQAIKDRGGRVTTSVSKKTSYILIGEEPGESKTKKAEQFGIKLLTEDDLLEMMESKPDKVKEKKDEKSPKKRKSETTPENRKSETMTEKRKSETATEIKKSETTPEKRKSETTPEKRKSETTPEKRKSETTPEKIKSETTPENTKSETTSAKRKCDTIPEKRKKFKPFTKIEQSPITDHQRKTTDESKASPGVSSQSSTTSTLSQVSTPSTSRSPGGCKSGMDNDLWVDKYRPTALKNIIGQTSDASNAKKLLTWMRNWSRNQSGKVKLVKPSPWAKDKDGAYFKAALLSGPPGVGKTTTVTLVCKEVGFDTVEFNASDTRSKRSIKEDITELLSNMSLAGFHKGEKITRQRVLVMDEVDGMAGNEDRGGMQELIGLIKATKIPIICMCNDRNSQKIRSLANYCFDLRYYKPRVEQIRGAMMSVCFKEGIKIKPDTLDEIIIGSNQDVRQILNHLSVWSADNKELGMEQTKKDAKMAKKEFKIGPWDMCTKVFKESGHKTMSIHDKIGIFFNDYSLGPLFVQENYPKVSPICARGNPLKLLDQLAKTAESICDGDLVEKTIRSKMAWSLLPTQALFSSVMPGEYLSGHITAQVEFPRWLGNFSRQKKFDRLAQELHSHMILRISGSKRDVMFDYAQHLRNAIVKPLAATGAEGVQDAVDVMTAHDLIREDLDSLLEISSWPHSKDHMAKIDSKVKSAFTRTLNKSSHLNPYGASNISKKKGKISDSMGSSDESEYEEDYDVTADVTISKKVVKQPKTTSKATTSRGKDKGKK